MFERMRSWFGAPLGGGVFLLPSLTGSPASCSSPVSSSGSSSLVAPPQQEQQQQKVLQNVSAADYPTPAKYLADPDSIPTYYTFQSNMVSDEDLLPGMLRNLEVDRRLTLPTRTHIRFLVTATDVIHSWAVPALGIKADAIPGRLQKVNTFIQREGVFYGQCSELCGALHGFMPIVVEAVSPETYAAHAKKCNKSSSSNNSNSSSSSSSPQYFCATAASGGLRGCINSSSSNTSGCSSNTSSNSSSNSSNSGRYEVEGLKVAPAAAGRRQSGSRKGMSNSGKEHQQQQTAAAKKQHQHQTGAATSSSSNKQQQQQSAAATASSSNKQQQQQSAAATASSSNRQ
ncbi:hypothetical protein Efla_006830 [Eimeria flavescens]